MPERLIIRREPTTAKPCAACGKVFAAMDNQLYCSSACRGRADYQRHKDKRNEARRERYRLQKQAQ